MSTYTRVVSGVAGSKIEDVGILAFFAYAGTRYLIYSLISHRLQLSSAGAWVSGVAAINTEDVNILSY